MSEHKIDFVVGDWSYDGHEESERFVVKSNLSVEQLRELHFSCPDKLGFDIGDICKQSEVVLYGIIEILIDKNIVQPDVLVFDYDDTEEDIENFERNDLEPENVVIIWLDILKYLANLEGVEFEYEIEPPLRNQTMHFYGLDDKKRHLNVPGYGTFYQ